MHNLAGQVWVVGAGLMARDHHVALKSLAAEHLVIGRGAASASRFEELTGVAPVVGGLSRALDEHGVPDSAIVAVPIEDLTDAAELLVKAGVRRLLVEKPGALSQAELKQVQRSADECGCEVFIAYNRRFIESTQLARRMIAEDGGATGVHMDLFERSEEVVGLPLTPRVKARWLIANTSHVLDMGFHLAGDPADWHASRVGSLPWHEAFCALTVSGTLKGGGVFTSWGDWVSPGRWGVTVTTRERRLHMRPLERLEVSRDGRGEPEVSVDPANTVQEGKPGMLQQASSFLSDDPAVLCSIDEQVSRLGLYEQIAGYAPKPSARRLAD